MTVAYRTDETDTQIGIDIAVYSDAAVLADVSDDEDSNYCAEPEGA